MKTVTRSSLGKLLDFLERLEASNITYGLEHVRDSIMVTVAVPGERWEIEFFEDEHIEIERFISAGEIEGEDALDRLFAEHSS